MVEDERWIDGPRFNRLLAVMQALPGPEAHELCVHLGMVARGRIGGLLAGLGFMLPGFLLMLLCGWGYAAFVAGRLGFAGILLGVQVAVLAVIVRAVQRIGGHVLTDATLWGIGAVAALATLTNVPFWVVLATAALAGLLPGRAGPVLLVAAAALLAWLFMPIAAPALMPVPALATPVGTAPLFVAGLKGGLLTFGGAYTAIPYVRSDTVGRGWLPDGTFLDGVALAGMLPAPLVIFATFVGYVAGGLAGAVAITAGMFLPAFAFSMIFFERLERVVDNRALHALLDRVAAAAVGIIAATVVQLALTVASRAAWLPALAIFTAALLLAWRWKSKWIAPSVVALGGAAGAALLG